MNKTYLVIYENQYGDIFKCTYLNCESKKELINNIKENYAIYGYKLLAVRKVASSENIYL